MRYSLILATVILVFAACKKDKFTTEPQIKYKSINPNAVDLLPTSVVPVLTISITDAEGDIGITTKDTAWIYMKNILTGTFDSLPFPKELSVKKNFQADVDITISKVLKCKSQPGNPLHTDILFFEVYVKDFAKNKSNVITTTDPVYFTCF
ncbi:MAG TPA: hypothetical protein VK484_06220 [Ferruginibacter sp.]|nr:hypothetical protein [Ferruginibacter sp.]